MLKVEVPAMGADSVINDHSNITEVLNVIAYLCNNTKRTDLLGIEDNQSVPKADHGQHTGEGVYTNGDRGSGASNNSLWLDGTGATATTQMIDLNSLQSLDFSANKIPVGILARRPGTGGVLGTTYATVANLDISAGVVGPIQGKALITFSNAIKQMIKILEHTRTIFGPKGWTALFNRVKGGGGSKHAKRTHRQHRRRYSSKQY
jgi:hypothetical protein